MHQFMISNVSVSNDNYYAMNRTNIEIELVKFMNTDQKDLEFIKDKIDNRKPVSVVETEKYMHFEKFKDEFEDFLKTKYPEKVISDYDSFKKLFNE